MLVFIIINLTITVNFQNFLIFVCLALYLASACVSSFFMLLYVYLIFFLYFPVYLLVG